MTQSDAMPPVLTPDELLTTTRAVRKRLDLDRPVERSVLYDCLRLALQAPTGGSRQGWRWVVVMEADKRKAIAEIYRAASRDGFSRALADAQSDSARKAYEGAIELAAVLERVPAIVIPCIKGRVDGEGNHKSASLYGSIIPAVWSFQLALRSRGLGSTYTTAHLRHEAAVAALLGIPESITQVALLPVAYTIGSDFKAALRAPVEEVAFIDEWDVPFTG